MSDYKFTVEQGVPIPARGNKSKYPFEGMKVGDSFIVPSNLVETIRRRAGKHREKHMPWHYRIGKDASGNTRLWRIEDTNKRKGKR